MEDQRWTTLDQFDLVIIKTLKTLLDIEKFVGYCGGKFQKMLAD